MRPGARRRRRIRAQSRRALPEGELLELLNRLGFREIALRERFDPFQGTSKERVARKFGAVGVNVHARRPPMTR
jgi:hypothetical protein